MKEYLRMRLLGIVLLLTFVFGGQHAAHKPSNEIDEAELREHLAKQYECRPDQIYFWKVDQFDFLGKGYDQSIVVASTCMTGTAGPDVHSVYTRDDKGELKELAMQELKMEHQVLFGNANSVFRIADGLLVDVYHDTSDRDDPLVVKYKWNAAKEMFEIVSVEAAKSYATSYDCTKAEADEKNGKYKNDAALAICYVESLADLDIDLAKLYKMYLAGLNAVSRKAAAEEQRNWLKKRNKECVIYKGWVYCLTEAYETRIAELKKEIEEQKKQAPSR
jgi:uncharacterized protein YecT (DUF1311 family)